MALIPEISQQQQKWVEIDPDMPLEPGDRILLTFKTATWVWAQSVEIAAIEAYCEGRKDFEIIRNSLPENNLIDYEIEIKNKYIDQTNGYQPPSAAGLAPVAVPILITAGKVAAVVIGVALIKWIAFDSAKKLVKNTAEYLGTKVETMKQTTGGQIALAGMGALGIAILLAVIGKYAKILK